MWKTFTDCFNCLPVAAIVDEKIFCCHGKKIQFPFSTFNYNFYIIRTGERSFNLSYSNILGGLSPDLQSMEQIRRIMRPTDVPDQGLLCDLLWSDPDKVSSFYKKQVIWPNNQTHTILLQPLYSLKTSIYLYNEVTRAHIFSHIMCVRKLVRVCVMMKDKNTSNNISPSLVLVAYGKVHRRKMDNWY